MNPSLIRVDQITPTPWLNGGGITRDLVAWPAPDDWALRISLADIEKDGPFSAYPGVQRWFVVLQGHGVRLRWPQRTVKLTMDNPPLNFDGAPPPGCALLDGPTRDLNLLINEDRAEGSMQRVVAGIEHRVPAALRAVFTCHDARLQIDGAPALALPAWSLLWTPAAAHQRWKLSAKAPGLRAWWIDVQPLAAS